MQVHNGGKADHKTGSQISATGDSTWCPHRERRTAEQATFKATHCAATGKTLFAYQWCVCVCVSLCMCVLTCRGVRALIEMYLLVYITRNPHWHRPYELLAKLSCGVSVSASVCHKTRLVISVGNQCFRASLSLKLSCHFMSNSLPQKTFSKVFLVTYMQFYFPFPVQFQIKSD